MPSDSQEGWRTDWTPLSDFIWRGRFSVRYGASMTAAVEHIEQMRWLLCGSRRFGVNVRSKAESLWRGLEGPPGVRAHGYR